MNIVRHPSFDTRVRAVNAILKGQRKVDVAMAYQIDYSTLHRWCERHRSADRKDFSVLKRRTGSGRPNLLNEDHREELNAFVLKPASFFGYETDFWTCRRLIQVVKQNLDIAISQPTMWRMLRDMGLTYQKPERRYFEANDVERKKWLRYQVPRIKATVAKHRAILYFQDESHISLTAILARTWAPMGNTPIQRVTGNRGGVAAMSAITSAGQLVFRLHQKRITSIEMIEFLAQLLRHHKRRNLVVVMDQAPPHTSKKTVSFIKEHHNLHVFYLPPYSPDWNPDEQVWNHLKHEELKGHQAKTKDELTTLARNRLTKMSRDPDLLNGIFFRCCIASFLK